MFRYGGPIKEGVMSGIREPKRDGEVEVISGVFDLNQLSLFSIFGKIN